MFARAKNALYGQKLDWQIETKQLFALFCDTPWAMLLDSAHAAHADAKYDVIAINPIATLTSDEGKCQFTAIDPNIAQLNIAFADAQTPLETLAHIHHLLYPAVQACEHPFSVGAVGAWGYDLGRSIEKLPEIADRKSVV